MTQADWNAAPLVWGNGPRLFEVFLEPTCPHSVLAFNKLFRLLDEVGEDRIRVRIWMQSQPWHLFSGVIVRCIIAASTLKEGKEAARKVMQAVADHRAEFEFGENHAGGENMNATPNQIVERIEKYGGVALKSAFAIPSLEREIKRHCRFARQNGIHFSPTIMIDGLIQPDMSSRDEVSAWAEKLLQ